MLTYLTICGLLFILTFGAGLEDDRRHWNARDSKHGYNYKSKLYWSLIIAVSCPVVNILTLVCALIVLVFRAKK